MERCQGDCGNCKADCRCYLPVLAGFVSSHSTGPGKKILPHAARLVEPNEIHFAIGQPAAAMPL